LDRKAFCCCASLLLCSAAAADSSDSKAAMRVRQADTSLQDKAVRAWHGSLSAVLSE
jgi:hypothetical protein